MAVVQGPQGTFAGAPASRAEYNHLSVGKYRLFFGVQFEGMDPLTLHAPDVSICHAENEDRPIIVIECKNWAVNVLPKPLVMAFVGMLHDLRFGLFLGCIKIPKKQLNQEVIASVDRDHGLCTLFGKCQSRLVATAPSSAPISKLQEAHDFLIEIL